MQSVTRLRAPAPTDRYGNAVDRDWSAAEETPIPEINLQPEPSGPGVGAMVGDRQAVTERWRLISPRGRDVDLVSTDRVRTEDGEILELDGEPARYHLSGRVHHVEARLKRVSA